MPEETPQDAGDQVEEAAASSDAEGATDAKALVDQISSEAGRPKEPEDHGSGEGDRKRTTLKDVSRKQRKELRGIADDLAQSIVDSAKARAQRMLDEEGLLGGDEYDTGDEPSQSTRGDRSGDDYVLSELQRLRDESETAKAEQDARNRRTDIRDAMTAVLQDPDDPLTADQIKKAHDWLSSDEAKELGMNAEWLRKPGGIRAVAAAAKAIKAKSEPAGPQAGIAPDYEGPIEMKDGKPFMATRARSEDEINKMPIADRILEKAVRNFENEVR